MHSFRCHLTCSMQHAAIMLPHCTVPTLALRALSLLNDASCTGATQSSIYGGEQVPARLMVAVLTCVRLGLMTSQLFCTQEGRPSTERLCLFHCLRRLVPSVLGSLLLAAFLGLHAVRQGLQQQGLRKCQRQGCLLIFALMNCGLSCSDTALCSCSQYA